MGDSSIGTLFVSFGADLTGFKSGVAEMKSSMGDIASTTSGVGSGISNIFSGVVSGAFGIAGQAAGFLKNQFADTFQVAEVHQGIMAQTAQVIKSTGDASGMSASAIANLGTSLSKVTTFSDDTIQSGENLLLTFTGIGKDVFPQTTKTMLDMAQAMGGDTKGAALMLGKALNDPATGLTALTRVGVSFSAQEKEQIKTMMLHHDVAGAQKVMLKELQTEFGGSAEAAGKTFAGSLQIVQNNLENAKQAIGGAFLPILGQLTSNISTTVLPAIQGFGDWLQSPTFKNFATGVGQAISTAFTDIGNVLKTIDWKAIGGDFTYLGQQLSPILTGLKPPNDNLFKDIGGVLKATVLDVGDFAKHLGDVVKFFKDGGAPAQVVKDALAGISIAIAAIKIGQFVASLPGLIGQLGLWATAQWAVAAPAIATALPYIAIGALIAVVVTGVILAIQHWGEISKWLVSVWNAIPPFFGGIWNAIAGFFGGIGNWFHDRWNEAAKGTMDAFGAIGKWFGDRWKDIQNAFGSVGNWFHDRFSEASKGVQSAFGNIGQFLMGLWNNEVRGWQVIGKWFHDRFTDAWNAITGIFSHIGQFLMGIWNNEVQGWKNIGNWFKDRFTDAWNAITGVFSHIGQFLMGLWNNEVQGWKNIGQWFHVCFTDAWNAVTGVFSHIGQFLMGLWDREVQGWKNIGNWFKDRFTDAWNAITGVFSHIGQFLMGLWNNEVQGWKNIGQWFKDRFTDAWDNITSVFGNIGNWFHDKWTGITTDFQSVLGGIGAVATNIWNGVTGSVKTAFNSIIDLINGVIKNIDNIKVAGFSVSIPLIPHLATGIENFVGGMALVGEKGPELVNLPRGANVLNHDKTASLFSGMSMNNNFKYPAMASQAAPAHPPVVNVTVNVPPHDMYVDGHKLTDAIMKHMASGIRLKGDVRSR